jgi:chromosome segregation ATPase
VGERVQSILKTRGGLQAQANDLSGQVEQLTTANQTLTSERDAAVARAEKAEAKVGEYEAELKKLEAAATTVSQGVVDQVAQLGISEASLPPSQGGDDVEETWDSIQAKLDQTTDPAERGRLAEKQIAIMGI